MVFFNMALRTSMQYCTCSINNITTEKKKSKLCVSVAAPTEITRFFFHGPVLFSKIKIPTQIFEPFGWAILNFRKTERVEYSVKN